MRTLLKISLLAACGILVSCTLKEHSFGQAFPKGGVSSIPSGYTGNAYPDKGYSSARRAYEKHRYYQPFHHHGYH